MLFYYDDLWRWQKLSKLNLFEPAIRFNVNVISAQEKKPISNHLDHWNTDNHLADLFKRYTFLPPSDWYVWSFFCGGINCGCATEDRVSTSGHGTSVAMYFIKPRMTEGGEQIHNVCSEHYEKWNTKDFQKKLWRSFWEDLCVMSLHLFLFIFMFSHYKMITK